MTICTVLYIIHSVIFFKKLYYQYFYFNLKFFLILTQGYFLLIWERETSIGRFTSAPRQETERTHNLGMCPDKELNLQPSGVQDDAPTNWATSQDSIFLKIENSVYDIKNMVTLLY